MNKKQTKLKEIIDGVAMIITMITAVYGLYLSDPVGNFLFMFGFTSREPMILQVTGAPSKTAALIFFVLATAVIYTILNRLIEKK